MDLGEQLDETLAELHAARAEIGRLRAVAAAARKLIAADDPYGEVREGTTHMCVLHDAVAALGPASAETGAGQRLTAG